MTPFHSTRFLNSEVLGSKFPAEVGVFFLQGDVNTVAVGAMAADGGEAQNPVDKDRMRVRKFSRGERGGVLQESEVMFGSWFGVKAG